MSPIFTPEDTQALALNNVLLYIDTRTSNPRKAFVKFYVKYDGTTYKLVVSTPNGDKTVNLT